MLKIEVWHYCFLRDLCIFGVVSKLNIHCSFGSELLLLVNGVAYKWTKLDKKQDLNILYQVCVFLADWKNNMAVLASFCLDIFNFSSETAEKNSTKLDRKQDLNAGTKINVFDIVATRAPKISDLRVRSKFWWPVK